MTFGKHYVLLENIMYFCNIKLHLKIYYRLWNNKELKS